MAETEEDLPRGSERDVLARIAAASIAEQRRARRWGIFFKSLSLLFLFALLFAAFQATRVAERDGPAQGPHTALVDVQGLISSASDASADRLARGLRDAFEAADAQAVLLRINSPGGSPVQAGMVYDEIQRLREAHPDTPVYAVATDLAASGGYYIAAAADRIYANRASMVGSIGVRFGGFGFVEAIDKLGVERRLITAGERKDLFDPFQPVEEADVAHVRDMIDDIHEQFIDAVRAGRGERLGEDPPARLFSGLVWTGEQAVELGLVDDLGSPAYVAREVIGAAEIVDYTPRKNLLERLSERVGAAFGRAVKTELLPSIS